MAAKCQPLSSQIKLDRVPRRYYAPQGELELAALTREEKIYTRIFETTDDGSAYLARHIAEVIRRNVAAKNRCVIALGAGRSTHSVYASLIDMFEKGEISFDRVTVFNLSEFFPLLPDGPPPSHACARCSSTRSTCARKTSIPSTRP